MNMTILKCETCGGNLEVTPEAEAATCRFCGSSYAQEKVRKMIVEHRGRVQIEGLSFEELLERGETFLGLGEYESAYRVFEQLSDLFPKHWEGWWGLVQAAAGGPVENITRLIPNEAQSTKHYKAALKFAPPEKAEQITRAYAPVLAAREAYQAQQAALRKRSAITRTVSTVLLVGLTGWYLYRMFFHTADAYLEFIYNFSGDFAQGVKGLYLVTFLPLTVYAVAIAVLFQLLLGAGSFGGYRMLSTPVMIYTGVLLTRAESLYNGGGDGMVALVLVFLFMALLSAIAMLPGLILSWILSKFG